MFPPFGYFDAIPHSCLERSYFWPIIMEVPGSPSMGFGFAPVGQPLVKLFKDFENCHAFGSQRTPKKENSLPQRNESESLARESAVCTEYTVEYLADLLKEKKQLDVFPQAFRNIERLVNDEIARVRAALFQCHFSIKEMDLPEPEGEEITVQEKIYVPRKEHPDFNFVGRILGPRGMTAKQLEQETGCKIMIRGRGSMRDRRKEEMNRGKPNWEHLDEELHVLVQCEDTPNRVYIKVKAAADEIRKLLVPAPEGTDELKRKQLMELAIINGTYRPISKYSMSCARLLTPMTLLSPIRPANTPMAPQPIFVSPTASPITPGTNVGGSSTVNTYLQSPNLDYNMMMNQLSLDGPLASVPLEFQQHNSPFPSGTSLAAPAAVPKSLQHYFIDPMPITPPGSTGSDRR